MEPATSRINHSTIIQSTINNIMAKTTTKAAAAKKVTAPTKTESKADSKANLNAFRDKLQSFKEKYPNDEVAFIAIAMEAHTENDRAEINNDLVAVLNAGEINEDLANIYSEALDKVVEAINNKS
jgi:hypothetical protein